MCNIAKYIQLCLSRTDPQRSISPVIELLGKKGVYSKMYVRECQSEGKKKKHNSSFLATSKPPNPKLPPGAGLFREKETAQLVTCL